jgi:hypothetical protein
MRDESVRVLKPCADFEVSADLGAAEHCAAGPFPELPAELEVASRIAAGLASRGYIVSTVGPGSGGGAGFSCRLDRACEIEVFMGVEAKVGDSRRVSLSTDRFPSLIDRVFRHGAEPTVDCLRRWDVFCNAINEVLADELKANSVVWQTIEELYERSSPSTDS